MEAQMGHEQVSRYNKMVLSTNAVLRPSLHRGLINQAAPLVVHGYLGSSHPVLIYWEITVCRCRISTIIFELKQTLLWTL